MTAWILEPRDPIVARDGRPFTAMPGARAVSFPLPMPSTIAGAARTRAGGDPFERARIPVLKATAVHGPFLVRLDDGGGVRGWYFQAPADVLAARGEEEAAPTYLEPLGPVPRNSDEAMNLPEGLLPLAPAHPLQGKPPREMPRYWTWEEMRSWLIAPAPKTLDKSSLQALGVAGPVPEGRVHVALMSGARVAREGALFSTEGRRFEVAVRAHGADRVQRFAMVVKSELGLSAGLDTLGAEGRIVAWRSSRPSDTPTPECPKEVIDSVETTGACRLVLATPGLFDRGFHPTLRPRDGVTPTLVAAAVPSPLTLSGFDLAAGAAGKPKRTRRLAPAGSVYFVRLEGDSAARRRWVDRAWLASIADADAEQDPLDGFGLALVGAWKPEQGSG